MLKQLGNGSQHDNSNQKITMTPDEMIQREPLLATVKDQLYGGIYHGLSTNGDMYEFSCQLKDILIQKYNVQFIFNEEVDDFLVSHVNKKGAQEFHITGIVTKTKKIISDVDNVIVANGNYVMQLMKKLNIYMPVYPVKVKIKFCI